jgi:aryl-alcohol dehydrogenase-like predicted oxidoreductase
MTEVVRSGRFEVMQTPYHLLNPSAGRRTDADFAETDFGNIIAECTAANTGVFAIRVLAGGALAGNPPSPHTLKTPFFPLSLYERDRERATHLQTALKPGQNLPREAIRFALAHPQIHSAIVGFASTAQIDEAITALEAREPPLTYEDVLAAIGSDE